MAAPQRALGKADSSLVYCRSIDSSTVGDLNVFVFFIVYGSLISLVNDYWDKTVDMKAGKTRLINSINSFYLVLILVFLFTLYFAILFFLGKSNFLTVLLGGTLVVLGIFYSSSPLRFKERPVLDVIIGSLIQRSLPVLVVFSAFGYKGVAGCIFIITLFILGVRIMLMHQLEDFSTDSKFGVVTLTSLMGERFSKRLIMILYLPEIILILLFSILTTTHVLILSYVLFWISVYLIFPEVRSKVNFFSLNEFLLSDFYYVWLPLYLAVSVFKYTGDPYLILLTLFFQKKHILILLRKIAFAFQKSGKWDK